MSPFLFQLCILPLHTFHGPASNHEAILTGWHPLCRIFWADPLQYATRALMINEFTAGDVPVQCPVMLLNSQEQQCSCGVFQAAAAS